MRMNLRRVLLGFITVFAVSLITCATVTLVWNLSVHRRSTIDWATSFRFAIVLGIVLPWIAIRRARDK